MKKISFLGDIMCEKPFLDSAIKRNNDFYTAFSNLQNLLNESDYVISNLETPIAGEELIYTYDLYSFNTPATFLDDLKKLNINLYLTANNHCIDRGVKGLKKTLDELDKREMQHTGTARSCEEQKNIFVANIGDTNCAFLSFNTLINVDKWFRYKNDLSNYNINSLVDNDKLINYRENYRSKTIPLYKPRKWLSRFLPQYFYSFFKRKLGNQYKPYIDNEPLSEIKGIYLDRAIEIIRTAKQKSDLVFVLPHCGGQFNIAPGIRSKELYQFLLSKDVDAIIACHPHVIQNIASINNKPCVYSLGNVSISPSSPYIVKSSLPQYGLIFHVYIENKKIVKTSFSIIKMVEEADHYLMVFPIDELYNKSSLSEQNKLIKELATIYTRTTGKEAFPGINREYKLSF